jgi:hypothetical protein
LSSPPLPFPFNFLPFLCFSIPLVSRPFFFSPFCTPSSLLVLYAPSIWFEVGHLRRREEWPVTLRFSSLLHPFARSPSPLHPTFLSSRSFLFVLCLPSPSPQFYSFSRFCFCVPLLFNSLPIFFYWLAALSSLLPVCSLSGGGA